MDSGSLISESMFPEYISTDIEQYSSDSSSQSDVEETSRHVYQPLALHPAQNSPFQMQHDRNQGYYSPECHVGYPQQHQNNFPHCPASVPRQQQPYHYYTVPPAYWPPNQRPMEPRNLFGNYKSTGEHTANLPFVPNRRLHIDQSSFVHHSLMNVNDVNDRRKLNNAVRKVVDLSGIRSVRGEAFNTCFNMLEKYLPHLTKDDRDVVKAVRLALRKNMAYRSRVEAMLGKKPEPARSKMPTDYLNFEDKPSEKNLQFGSEVCITHNSFPVGKARIITYPATEEGMTAEEKTEFASVQILLKKRNQDVPLLPFRKDMRNWSDITKGSRLGWRIDEIQSVELYDNFQKAVKQNKQRLWVKKKRTTTSINNDSRSTVSTPVTDEIKEMSEEEQPEEAHLSREPPVIEEVYGVEQSDDTLLSEEDLNSTNDNDNEDGTDKNIDKRYRLHDYVEVAFQTTSKRKATRLFYAMIKNLKPLTVSFLRDTDKKNIKVWPLQDDTSTLEWSELVRKLDIPVVDKRQRLHFND